MHVSLACHVDMLGHRPCVSPVGVISVNQRDLESSVKSVGLDSLQSHRHRTVQLAWHRPLLPQVHGMI